MTSEQFNLLRLTLKSKENTLRAGFSIIDSILSRTTNTRELDALENAKESLLEYERLLKSNAAHDIWECAVMDNYTEQPKSDSNEEELPF